MNSVADFQIAVNYLVVVHLGVWLYFHWTTPRLQVEVSRLASPGRMAIWLIWIGILVIYLREAYRFRVWDLRVPPGMLWVFLSLAAIEIAVAMWAMRSRLGSDDSQALITEGPYRFCRYPLDAAQSFFFPTVGALTANWGVFALSIVLSVTLRLFVPPKLEAQRIKLLGDIYRQHALHTGVFLPTKGPLKRRQYQVPSRFSLTTIIGLLTFMAVLFGTLKSAEVHPIVYLFVGAEILAICCIQIVFGSAPRVGSAVVGGILLPACVFAFREDLRSFVSCTRWSWLANDYPMFLTVGGVTTLAFGILLGYCIGAIAAGLFLVMEMLEPWLLRAPKRTSASTSAGRSQQPRGRSD